MCALLPGGLGEIFFLYSLERVHSEGHVHAWAVREEGGQGGLLKQPKDQNLVPDTQKGEPLGPVRHKQRHPSEESNLPSPARGRERTPGCRLFLYSLHALLEDRVPPGLADDEVGPLDDDDAGEEGRVAGELHDLPLLVGLTGDRAHVTNTFNQLTGRL